MLTHHLKQVGSFIRKPPNNKDVALQKFLDLLKNEL